MKIDGFDSEKFEVVTYDCVSLYTSINIDRVLEHILDIIYNDPLKFFPPRTKKVTILQEVITKTIEPPPRKLLDEFFRNILSNFNNFESLGGFYKQIKC